MLRAMRIRSLGAVALFAAAAVACKSSDQAAGPRKLRKMDFHTTIDDRGRLRVAFRMFDAKHEQMPVDGSYTVEVTKVDGALICKAAGELAPADFSAKGTHQAPWHEAGCPADPGADEVKVNVKVTVPAGDAGGGGGKEKEDKGKDDKGAAKDIVFDRSITIPVRSIYDRPPPKKPTAGSAAAGSAAAGSAAAGSAAAGSAATGSAATGSAAAGSAAKPAEKPTAEKPTAEKPAEKPADAKPAAGSAR
jgi:hypothetical protein